jgi:hypothetical protein
MVGECNDVSGAEVALPLSLDDFRLVKSTLYLTRLAALVFERVSSWQKGLDILIQYLHLISVDAL